MFGVYNNQAKRGQLIKCQQRKDVNSIFKVNGQITLLLAQETNIKANPIIAIPRERKKERGKREICARKIKKMFVCVCAIER